MLRGKGNLREVKQQMGGVERNLRETVGLLQGWIVKLQFQISSVDSGENRSLF